MPKKFIRGGKVSLLSPRSAGALTRISRYFATAQGRFWNPLYRVERRSTAITLVTAPRHYVGTQNTRTCATKIQTIALLVPS